MTSPYLPLTLFGYLTKVILALSSLAGAVLMSLDPDIALSLGVSQTVAVLACLAAMLALVPLAFILYKRMDELNRHLHQTASAISLPLLASIIGILGVLQVRGFLPLFNQFWLLGGLIVLWGVALMLCDRRFR